MLAIENAQKIADCLSLADVAKLYLSQRFMATSIGLTFYLNRFSVQLNRRDKKYQHITQSMSLRLDLFIKLNMNQALLFVGIRYFMCDLLFDLNNYE